MKTMDLELLLLTTAAMVIFDYFLIIRIWKDFIPQRNYIRMGTYGLLVLMSVMVLVREYYRFFCINA